MSAELLEFFTVYGLAAVPVILAMGQFGVPLPTSILLMTVGALSVEGDISATPAALDPTFRVGVYAFGPLPALVTRFDDVVFDF